MNQPDRSLIDDIARSIPQQPRLRATSVLKKRGGVDSKVGTGTPGSDGVGIASPLTEPDAGAREYWPEQTIQSDYALFALRIKPIKTVYMQDANGETVVLQFAEPV